MKKTNSAATTTPAAVPTTPACLELFYGAQHVSALLQCQNFLGKRPRISDPTPGSWRNGMRFTLEGLLIQTEVRLAQMEEAAAEKFVQNRVRHIVCNPGRHC